MNSAPLKHAGRPQLPADDRAGSNIHLRVTRARKALYVRTAGQSKLSLAAWMFSVCDAEAERAGLRRVD